MELSYSFVAPRPTSLQLQPLEPVIFADDQAMVNKLKEVGVLSAFEDRPTKDFPYEVTADQLREIGFRQVP
jgi:hypothetical protein